MSEDDYTALIPNNVDLASDARLKRALEAWYPKYLDWWRSMGPDGFQGSEVYLSENPKEKKWLCYTAGSRCRFMLLCVRKGAHPAGEMGC